MTPRVSVILPVYNSSRFVARAIESVLSQSVTDVEILVVDDGSTDDTVQVLRAFHGKVRVLSQVNQGCYVARNHALAHARGEYLAFLDADDAWLPGKLDQQLALFAKNADVGLVHGDATIEHDGHLSDRTRFDQVPAHRGRVFAELARENFIPTSSATVRRACFDVVGPFREVRLAADYHKWLQIAQRFALDHVDDPISVYALHGGNISANRANQIKSLAKLVDELAARSSPDEAALLRRRLVDLRFQWAAIEVTEGLRTIVQTSLAPVEGMSALERMATLGRLVRSSVRAKLR